LLKSEKKGEIIVMNKRNDLPVSLLIDSGKSLQIA
jgi:hypothetical protein